MELIRLGELGGGITERLEQVGGVWRDAGFNVKCFDDIDQLVWEKFVCNVTYSGSCTIFECTIAAVQGNEHAWQVASSCAAEAHAAGVAKGVHFSFDDPGRACARIRTEDPERPPVDAPGLPGGTALRDRCESTGWSRSSRARWAPRHPTTRW